MSQCTDIAILFETKQGLGLFQFLGLMIIFSV